MTVLVTGAKGQLGQDVIEELNKRGIKTVGTDIDDMDITDETAVFSKINEIRPGAVIHCAAWTNVDGAEDPANIETVEKINVKGTENIAKACKSVGCKILYISTDYVFDGTGEKPWDPDCKDYAPLSVYGKTKLAGEKCVAQNCDKFFIVRISWLFGLHGKNFVATMLKLSESHPSLRVVSDQIGTPTYCRDLASVLVDMIVTDKYGYYHVSNEGGYISWADFAKEIFRQSGKNTEVIPVTTEEYGISKAKRPFNSRLDKSKLTRNGFNLLPTWQDALSRYLKETEQNVNA